MDDPVRGLLEKVDLFELHSDYSEHAIYTHRRGTREDLVSKDQIQPEYGDEQADAGRDG